MREELLAQPPDDNTDYSGVVLPASVLVIAHCSCWSDRFAEEVIMGVANATDGAPYPAGERELYYGIDYGVGDLTVEKLGHDCSPASCPAGPCLVPGAVDEGPVVLRERLEALRQRMTPVPVSMLEEVERRVRADVSDPPLFAAAARDADPGVESWLAARPGDPEPVVTLAPDAVPVDLDPDVVMMSTVPADGIGVDLRPALERLMSVRAGLVGQGAMNGVPARVRERRLIAAVKTLAGHVEEMAGEIAERRAAMYRAAGGGS